jgi:hypothetical protein
LRKELDHIIERFPESKDVIITLYYADEDFRSLCDDYWLSSQSLLKLQNKILTDKESEVEYREICLDLEKKIMLFLKSKRDEKK